MHGSMHLTTNRKMAVLWTKELPGGRKVISYETWLRINHHPAGLDLLDQYQTEMRSIAEGIPKAEKPE